MARASTNNPWLDILTAQIDVGREAIEAFSSIIGAGPRDKPKTAPERLDWPTPHTIFRDLATLRVLDFTNGGETPTAPATLIVAPYALHRASIADFARGHSVVETLLREGARRLYLIDWRSAVPERKFDSIDTHLAELNVAVDDIGRGEPVALVGLCQGGWLAAVFAARFPSKVKALALVGAPIDIAAEPSALSGVAYATPIGIIDEVLKMGDGLLLGRVMLASWLLTQASTSDVHGLLQWSDALTESEIAALTRRFEQWNQDVIDLPGVFYREVVEWIFRENRLARGEFIALGDAADLKRINCPLFLLAARDDEVVSLGQIIAMTELVGTPAKAIETRIVAGRHLSLFLGRDTLAKEWPDLARFLVGARRGFPVGKSVVRDPA